MPAEADSRSIPKDIPSLSYKNVDELRANLSEVLLRDAGSSLGAFKKDIDNFRRDRHNFEKPIEKIVVSEKATANDWLPSYLIR